ncbi:acyl carrier protein [Streptomyces sp. N2-109]|uniref:Acyl carrier protein n=1 Tax=Streptomyces gossypii TaxID=2883101 RepID=A0ABT2JM64_9ACTN|nr:acyl carrier protein [Streptomyces gossypii]MCT2588460.1 acyl carrier protein [Streptomyces gossypii]
MAAEVFTLADLTRIVLEAAGGGESVDWGDEKVLDTEFEALGYESLALLETGGRIEREYGISLDDEALSDMPTPRALIETVNAHLSAAARTV